MYLTGPPDAAGHALRVSRAECRVFDGTSELATDPALRGYLADMVEPYGLALREDLLDAGAGHSYGEMAEPLIETIVPDGSPVDLLVLAYGIHDVRLGRATATYLGSRCPGDPLSFAVCDQGVAAPFTALRLIEAYAATGACRRALLVVAEQSALHYELAAPAPVPARNAAVALLLEESASPDSLTVRQHTELAPNEVEAHLRADVDASGAEALILGGGLANLTGSFMDEICHAPQTQPYTGIWWELATRLADGPVLLAEYDPALQYLCTAVARLDPRAAGHNFPRGGTEVISMAAK